MSKLRRASGLLAVAVSLAACNTGRQSPGGNNAPIAKPKYPTVSTPRSPTATSTTTTQPAKQNLHVNLPGGGQSYVGTPQYGHPWTVKGSADWVAAQWVIGYKSMLYTYPAPGWWMVLIKPYTTSSFYNEILPPPSVRNPRVVAPADRAFWATVQKNRQSTRIVIDQVNRVNQAGFTATSEVAEVLYSHIYESRSASNPYPTNATVRYLCMVKQGGKWLVNNETRATHPIAC